jgi:hypothetical protein
MTTSFCTLTQGGAGPAEIGPIWSSRNVLVILIAGLSSFVAAAPRDLHFGPTRLRPGRDAAACAVG